MAFCITTASLRGRRMIRWCGSSQGSCARYVLVACNAPRPVRQGDRGRGALERGAVRLPVRRPGRRATTTTAPRTCRSSVVINPFFDWGDDRAPRTPYHETVIYEAHVKGLTKLHPGDPRAAARHVRGPGRPGDDRPPAGPGRDGDRADAGAPVRPRRRAGPARPVELLGLQHDRLLRPAQRLRGQRPARRAGAGVQADGAHPARGGHRGHPRRRLQPHRRGQPPRARRWRSAASTTRATTGSSTATRGTTWTPPAPATASTSSSRTRSS